jgi:hypothetical protein
MPFEIIIHRREAILEVVYPAHPSEREVADYLVRIRRSMAAMGGPWDCLVDQRKLSVMAPHLVERIAVLNAEAERLGMRRSARVVPSAVGQLQAGRMAREASLQATVRTFATPQEAMHWLAAARADPANSGD